MAKRDEKLRSLIFKVSINMSFKFIHFFIFWKFLVPPGGTAGPLATPLALWSVELFLTEQSVFLDIAESAIHLGPNYLIL